MHSNSQLVLSAADGNGSFECRAVGHEGRAGDDALAMRVKNASAHLLGKSKIVGVDNELPHGYVVPPSCAGRAMEYLAARSSPRAVQNTMRILRIMARETPSAAV